MQIALTGATGFIGRYIVKRLLQDGHTLTCWHRESSDLSGLPNDDRIQWVHGNLGDPAAASILVHGCDALIHNAFWHPSGGFQGGEGDLVHFAEVNVLGSLRLFQAAAHARHKRIVYVSSCAVHDHILDDRTLDETHPLRASNHYGAHKAAVEKFVHSLGDGHGVPICAVRPTGVYGLNHPASDSKWMSLVRDVVAGKDVHCEKGGKEVHAADVASAIVLLLNQREDAIRGEAFNCYDRYVSQWDVAHMAKVLSGSESKITGGQTSPKHQIETGKIRALGMNFGGEQRLRLTIGQLVAIVQGEGENDGSD